MPEPGLQIPAFRLHTKDRILAWPDTQAAKLKELREMTPLAMAGSLGDQLMHYMRRHLKKH